MPKKINQYQIQDLITLMSRLRHRQYGCSWDQKQTYQSLTRFTLEEVYEVIDAIDKEDYPHLMEELGDLLFHIIFYSQLGNEDGFFDFDQVVDGVVKKMLYRHPHVFPEGTLDSAKVENNLTELELKQQWEDLKQSDSGQNRSKSTIPFAMPAMLRATKLLSNTRKYQKNKTNEDCMQVIDSLIDALSLIKSSLQEGRSNEEDYQQSLLLLIRLSQLMNLDPESQLRQACKPLEAALES